MPIIVISNKDPLGLETFDNVIAEIEASLFNLRVLSLDTDFDNVEARQNFANNISYLKRFYERAERIVTV